MGWIFLGYVWGSKSDSFTFVVASWSLLVSVQVVLKFFVLSFIISEQWGSTWVGCYLSSGF